MPGRKYPKHTVVKTHDGGEYHVPAFTSQEIFDSAISYQPQTDDLFVATFPKNGTTWMLYIMHMLYGKCTDFDEGDTLFKHYVTLDFDGAEKTKQYPSPRLIKTHYRFDITPMSDKAKYIFVARNPKDTLVSFFHHTVGFKFYDYADGSFDDYFEYFMNGQNEYGNYFEMVPVWWHESKTRKNIHFLLYEDLKNNFERELLKIAEFLGEDFKNKLLNDDKKLLKLIAQKSDIKTMQSSLKSFTPPMRLENRPFTRKGIVGDWKNIMNEKQSQLVETRLREAGKKYPGFDKLWEEYREYL